MPVKTEKAERRQAGVKKIWGLAKCPELKLSDEELHLLVQAHTGKCSIRELSLGEISSVVHALIGLKESARKGRGGQAYGAGNPDTVNQRRKVYKLAQGLGWDGNRVNGLARRMFKVARVEWLTYVQCSKLIEAMKAMAERQGKRDA